jgi:hypothetical protein
MKRGTINIPTIVSTTRKSTMRPIVAASPLRREPRARRDRREDSHEDDRDQVFDEENADNELAQPSADALFDERLGDDRGARDRDDRTGKHTLQHRPSEEPAREEPKPRHEARLHDGREPRRWTDPHQFREVELEAERKHQEDDAELGQRLDDAGIGHDRDRDMRPDDQSRDDVTEHDRLAQPLEHDGRDRRNGENDGQRPEELVHVGHDRQDSPVV